MNNMKARYIRISTPNQNKERQLINKHPNEIIFMDVCSGSILFAQRTKSKELLEAVAATEIELVSVHAIDRLGRNLLDILTTLKIFTDAGVIIKVDNLGIESMINGKVNPAFNLIVSVMGNIAEMERETMLERQREGIAIAKAKGNYKGRQRGTKETRDEVLHKYPDVVKHLKKGQSLRNTVKLAGVSLSTVQKVKSLLV
jgi:DNA invertase Pin-like site-specific DNA recombinase